MKVEQKIQLENLIGKQVKHKGEYYIVKSFKQVTALVVVSTTTKKILLGVVDELPKFLETNPVSKNSPAKTKTVPPVPETSTLGYKSVIVTENPTSEIETALLNMLSLVQENDDYIPKAAAVCNIVDTAVKVERQKLEIKKYLDK